LSPESFSRSLEETKEDSSSLSSSMILSVTMVLLFLALVWPASNWSSSLLSC